MVSQPEPQQPQASTVRQDATPAVLTHLGGIVLSFVPSLVVWLAQREAGTRLAEHAKEALNLQLTLLVGYVVAAVVGLMASMPLSAIVWIVGVVFAVQSAIAASRGELRRTKGILRLVR